MKKPSASMVGPVSNDAAADIAQPFSVKISIEGTAPLLFHAWSVEAVTEKAAAAKGSKAKKSDNVESYVYRNEKNEICLPGEYFRQAIIHAAKFLQDPRSPRKSAMDLFKAGIVVLTEYAPITSGRGEGGAGSGMDGRGEARPAKAWDFLDQRRVVVQRNGINRVRPAFFKGWRCALELQVILPEYITREGLAMAIIQAGRLIGVGDFRPTYGRFVTTEFI